MPPDEHQSLTERLRELIEGRDDDDDGGDDSSSNHVIEAPRVTFEPDHSNTGSVRFNVEQNSDTFGNSMFNETYESTSSYNPTVQTPAERRDTSTNVYHAMMFTKHDKLYTSKDDNMDVNSIETWFLERAFEQFPTGRVGDIYADGGFNIVREAVLEDAADEIEAARNEHGDWIEGFNRVTMEWPHEARAYQAAYEANADRPDETYTEKTQEFAEANDVLDYEDEMQSEVDWFHQDNPFRDSELSYDEAKVVLLLRANDEDEEHLEDIENASNFYGWYQETGDVEAAIRACRFDSSIPSELAPRLEVPENWDELDPDNIREETCAHCGNNHHHVELAEEGVAWWRENTDETVEAVDITSEEWTNDSPHNILCDRCYNDWQENSKKVTYFNGDAVYRYQHSRGISKDYGVIEESVFEPMSLLTSHEQDSVIEVAEGSHEAVPDTFALSPMPRNGVDPSDQHDAIEEAQDNPEEVFSEGGVMIVSVPHFEARQFRLVIPRTSPTLAREAKELLDDPSEVLA